MCVTMRSRCTEILQSLCTVGSRYNTIQCNTIAYTSHNWQKIWYQWCNLWWRHQLDTFPALLAFVREIHRFPIISPHKGHWRGTLMFSLICTWINGCVKNREAGDLGRNRAHYYVTVMHERYHYSDSHERNGVLKPRHLDCLFNFVIVWYKRKHRSSRYRPFVRGVHRWPVDSHHKGLSNVDSVYKWRHHDTRVK